MENQNKILENIEIADVAAEGKAIAKHNGMIVFVKGAIPGDRVDLEIYRKKKNYAEARVLKFHKYSEKRNEPFCRHFGTCGGCVWQNLKYEEQLFYKQKQVKDAFEHIGKFCLTPVPSPHGEGSLILPIIPSAKTQYYRNKLDFAFSNKRWLTYDEIRNLKSEIRNHPALGFHISGLFDKVLDIEHCYLQPSFSNEIRLEIKKYALENNLSFFDLKKQEGFLRNLIIRNSSLGEWMVILVFAVERVGEREKLLLHISQKFSQITSLQYIINPKKNDSIFDLAVHLFRGRNFIYENLGDLKFKISAKSFFQTNTEQAIELYKTVRKLVPPQPSPLGSVKTQQGIERRQILPIEEDLPAGQAGLGGAVVYDLYTGTGTIANFIARDVKKVIGIDYISDAIADAKENSKINNISNTEFFAGDIKDVLNDDFVSTHGKPNIIITDPPRAGMDEKVVRKILEIEPQKIVYVSCNPATQARDAAMLSEKYSLKKLQPVDMFPHAHHLENVALMERK